MVPEHRRHDISYNIWELLKYHLPGREGAKGVAARDNRLFINAFFWILRIGSPWRGLPPDYGNWKNTHRRFCRAGQEQKAATRTWDVQKGAQLKDTPGRGYAWYAGQNGHHARCRCGLYTGLQTHRDSMLVIFLPIEAMTATVSLNI